MTANSAGAKRSPRGPAKSNKPTAARVPSVRSILENRGPGTSDEPAGYRFRSAPAFGTATYGSAAAPDPSLARAVGEAFWDALNEPLPTPSGDDQNRMIGTLTPHAWAAAGPAPVVELKKVKKRTDKRGKNKPVTNKPRNNKANSKGDKASKKGKKPKK